jgi:hypothetical protein
MTYLVDQHRLEMSDASQHMDLGLEPGAGRYEALDCMDSSDARLRLCVNAQARIYDQQENSAECNSRSGHAGQPTAAVRSR